MPPAAGEEGAGGVGEEVAGIAGDVREEMGRDDFGDGGPDGEVEDDFAPARWGVVGAEAEPALKPEREGECGGDQQQVVEVAVEKRAADVAVEPETVERVERAGREAERIEGVGETFHRERRRWLGFNRKERKERKAKP